MGFFSGITWAILVARVCMWYPNVIKSQLIITFFTCMWDWDWYKLVIKREKLVFFFY